MMKERASERIEFLNSDVSGAVSLFDLSKTGVACLFEKSLKEGATVRVELNDMLLSATVVYSQQRTDGYRLGLHFQNVPSDKQKKIDELVESFSRGMPIKCQIAQDATVKA